ncbi:hypothetical protein A9K55_008834 [Cordyceps militaris]|uniref:Uncharacterized protein n=1 Tax=Cordyceps militaris TaxID=73501 RepID=A0A2H4SII9_CORMI|nr:hypothetical protein A9K55_008834 [Cordyceps militaris]
MSETATISSISSGRRPALDLSETLPLTRMPNIRLIGASSSTPPSHESFLLGDKFIYATSSTPASAAYHLSPRRTRSGQPWQLAISHVLPGEARLLSSPCAPLIRYDDDLTLHTGEKLSVPFSIGPTPLLCIRGRGLAGGTVVVKTMRRGYGFWHMTPLRRPLTRVEEERLQAVMHRRGYRTSDDWRRELLYTARRGREGRGEVVWLDARGVVVARESDGQLVVGGAEAMEASAKDLLVACWASRTFVQSTPDN